MVERLPVGAAKNVKSPSLAFLGSGPSSNDVSYAVGSDPSSNHRLLLLGMLDYWKSCFVLIIRKKKKKIIFNEFRIW